MLDKECHAVAKLLPNLFQGHVGVFNGIVQDGGGKHFGIAGDGGHNCSGFHRMKDIGVAFATAFGAAMGYDGKLGGLIEERGFEGIVHG